MTILRDLSMLWSLFHILILFILLYRSRYPRKKTYILTGIFMTPLVALNVAGLVLYGTELMGKVFLLTCTLPSFIFFWFMSEDRKGQFFFTFCLADTVSYWIIVVTNLADFYFGGEKYILMFIGRLVLFPLAEWAAVRFLRKPYRELQESAARGWGLFAGMTSIGEGAFRECKKLTDITIPASVKNIGDSAFYTCSKLTTVTMQGDPPNLGGNYVFADCAFKLFNDRGIHVPKGRAQDYKNAWKNLENYITDHTHSWASAWTTNETHHWHECTESDCPITDNADKGGYGVHVYDNDSDTTCNTCGYTRTLQDTQPPTGEIKIEGHSWTQFLKNITFKYFFSETKQVTITAQDTGSGVDKIYYYISNYELESEENLKWLDWTEGSSFSIDPDKQCVIYVKITDKAGNVTYLSTDGLVFDATPPVISGVTDGGTYNEPQTVTVTDAMFFDVKSVTVNGT